KRPPRPTTASTSDEEGRRPVLVLRDGRFCGLLRMRTLLKLKPHPEERSAGLRLEGPHLEGRGVAPPRRRPSPLRARGRGGSSTRRPRGRGAGGGRSGAAGPK